MKRIIQAATALILALALCACGAENSDTASSPASSEPTQAQDEMGSMEIKTGVYYLLEGYDESESLFFHPDNTVDCEWPGDTWRGWLYSVDGDTLTITDGETTISFTILDGGDTLVGEYGRFMLVGDVQDEQTGNVAIANGAFFSDLMQIGDHGDNMSPFEAASGLYYRVLSERFDISEENHVYITRTDIKEIDGMECYLFEVYGSFGLVYYAVNYDYGNQNVYEVSGDRSNLIGSILDLGSAKGYEATHFTLFADFSAGSTDAEPRLNDIPLPPGNEMPSSNALVAFFLADSLSEWTGLDFTLNDVAFGEEGSITVDWSADSTLIAGLGGRAQKEDFRFFDAVSLNWFMMDSLALTLKHNLPVTTVYYCSDGKPVAFVNQGDMVAQGLPILPVDQPYEGSAFFAAHLGGRGDFIENAGIPEWWGEYRCDDTNFSIGITNFNGQSFLFGFYNLRNGELFFDGTAAVYSADELMAEHGEISFALSGDYGAIGISAPENSEWGHLSGRYERIDNGQTS